jgi:hypothetical protein
METTFLKLSTAHLNAQAFYFYFFFVSVPLVMVAGNAVDD